MVYQRFLNKFLYYLSYCTSIEIKLLPIFCFSRFPHSSNNAQLPELFIVPASF